MLIYTFEGTNGEMFEMDNTLFYESLLLTQAFCDKQLLNTDKNVASILRSINPIYHGKKLFDFKITDYGYVPESRYGFSTEWTLDPLRNESTFYKDLFAFQLSQKRLIIGDSIIKHKFEGRILVAEIDHTLTDGASEVASDGLIDVYDCPPIDTWFYFANDSAKRSLFAWIPQQFVYNANEAIEVNCLDSLYWFERQL